MPRKRIHVIEPNGAFLLRGCTTHAPSEGNVNTAVTALVRTDLEVSGADDPIKAGPVEVLERAVQFATDRRQGGYPVGVVLYDGFNALTYFAPGLLFVRHALCGVGWPVLNGSDGPRIPAGIVKTDGCSTANTAFSIVL